MAWNLLFTSDIGLLSLFTILFMLVMLVYIARYVSRHIKSEAKSQILSGDQAAGLKHGN
jgi:hypothetical protein